MRAQSFQYVLDVDLACKVGLNESIILKNIAYWVFKNETNERNLKDGRYWSYNSLQAFAKQFPFWTVKTIRTLLNHLLEDDWIIKAHFNAQVLRNTTWYSLSDKALCYFGHETPVCPNGQVSLPDTPEGQVSLPKTANYSLPAETNQFAQNGKLTNYTNNRTYKEIHKEDARAMAAPAALPFDLLPDSPLKEALLSYRESRRNLQAPMTDRAEQLALEMLESLAPGDTKTQIAIVNQSVLNGWRGLFQLNNLQEPMQYQRAQNTHPASGYHQRTAGDDARAAYEEALKYLDKMDDDGNFRLEDDDEDGEAESPANP